MTPQLVVLAFKHGIPSRNNSLCVLLSYTLKGLGLKENTAVTNQRCARSSGKVINRLTHLCLAVYRVGTTRYASLVNRCNMKIYHFPTVQ